MLNENESPEIIETDELSWDIDDSLSDTQEIYDVFYRWLAKNNRKPHFQYKNIQKVLRPNLNRKVVYTIFVIYACEVCSCCLGTNRFLFVNYYY